mmetsp:Transcript_12397/g.37231  ORF Transcript_12397/g.37231 Transcript_12397/m.37231 type:complete len:236 (+) Transcript_12397:4430-5137(+)
MMTPTPNFFRRCACRRASSARFWSRKEARLPGAPENWGRSKLPVRFRLAPGWIAALLHADGIFAGVAALPVSFPSGCFFGSSAGLFCAAAAATAVLSICESRLPRWYPVGDGGAAVFSPSDDSTLSLMDDTRPALNVRRMDDAPPSRSPNREFSARSRSCNFAISLLLKGLSASGGAPMMRLATRPTDPVALSTIAPKVVTLGSLRPPRFRPSEATLTPRMPPIMVPLQCAPRGA